MTRESRLAALVDGLAQDIQAGQVGHHHRVASADDAADIACAFHDEMDQGTAARDDLAQRNGISLACTAGCAACCENLIMVWEPEARAIARYLERPENQAARAGFLSAHTGWRARVGDAPSRARALHLSGDRGGYERAVQAVWRKRIMCAFNVDGACSIYPVRPNVCRNCHAVDTPDHCSSDSETPPQALAFAPLDEFLRKTQTLTTALQVTMRGGDASPESVCGAVHKLITQRPQSTAVPSGSKPGRNSPCPCGSGTKFKRCCGA